MSQKNVVMYHDTTIDHLQEILMKGLKAQKPFKRERKPNGVYLTTSRFRWMFWATDRHVYIETMKDCEKIPLGVEIKVNTTGLEVVPDGTFGYAKDEDKVEPDKDFICLQDISPDRIVEVLVEKRTDPTKFGGFEPIDIQEYITGVESV